MNSRARSCRRLTSCCDSRRRRRSSLRRTRARRSRERTKSRLRPTFSSSLQLLYRFLQFDGDLFRADTGFEFHRLPDAHANLVRRNKFFARLLGFEQAIDSHRQNGNAEILRQQSDAGAERVHFSVRRVTPFWKHQHAVAAIHGLASIGEAATESSLARQWKEIEQRHTE